MAPRARFFRIGVVTGVLLTSFTIPVSSSIAAVPASVAGEVYAVTQTKIVDTRTGLGAPKAALTSAHTLNVTVAGKGGVPATGAAAAVLQLTVVSATRTSSLTMYPAGSTRPTTPSVVATAGRSTSIQFVSKLGTGGKVAIYNTGGAVQLTVSTQAWSTTGVTNAAGTRLAPLNGARILDTRVGTGANKAAIGAGKAVTFAVSGKGGVPSSGAVAVALNVTGYSPTATTSLTVYPAGATRPATPNVVLTKARTVSAAVITKLGSLGRVTIYNAAGTVQIAADVQGAFRSAYPAGGLLTSVKPARLVRTTVGAGKTVAVQVTGHGGVPTTRAIAAAFGLSGSAATANTGLTVYPYGSVRPAAPNVWVPKAGTATNATITKLGTGGKVFVYNSAGSTSVSLEVRGYFAIPPALPQPPDTIITSGAHSLYDQAKFLFTGSNPAQTGVAAGVIKPEQIGVIRGKALVGSNPLPGVAITILKHPEYGATKTATDGTFSMAVNAGAPMIVDYRAAGYSTSQRQPLTTIGQYVWADDAVLVPLDTKVTAIAAGTATTTTAAVSSTVTDSDGTRTNAVLFPAGTTATATKPDGSTVPLPATLHVRATEYTVGTTGPERMPGDLPASSAYTYATNLTVDEATSLGATEVDFSKPLANYVDNFLHFPVGTPVPAGYYDATKGEWVASQNGVVVKLLSVDGSNRAVLDTDGDNAADSAAQYTALNITDAERTRLATTYTAGKTLWRVPITHFTPWDYNWPYGLPDDAKNWSDQCDLGSGSFDLAACNAQTERETRKKCEAKGSIIGCQDQTLGQRVGINSTPLNLVYNSGTQPGRTTDRRVTIPLTFSTPSPSLQGVQLEIDVAGQHHALHFGAAPNQKYTFTWDGLDGFGRPLNGAQEVTVRIGYEYKAVYKATPEALNASFALAGGAAIAADDARQNILVWTELTTQVGSLRPDSDALGGWTVDVHHSYDPATHTLYLGGGQRRSDNGTSQGVISSLTLTGSTFSDPKDIAAAPDGSVYVADSEANKIYKVSANGVVTLFAGTGVAGYTGDDGPATAAKLFHPTYLALGPDGSLYLTDGFDAAISRVRKIAPNGIISTVAGTFNSDYNGDGIPAVDANLKNPAGVAVGIDGSVYIADEGNARIRRVNPDGIITTVAGDGSFDDTGDGGPAAMATIVPTDVAVAPDGTVYASTQFDTIRAISPTGQITLFAGDPLADPEFDDGVATHVNVTPAFLQASPAGGVLFSETGRNRIREVANGRITTVAGDGTCDGIADETGDGGAATLAQVCSPLGVSVAAGVTHLVESEFFGPSKLRRIGSIWPGFQLGETTLASPTGDQVFVFDAGGRHKRTVDALTGAIQWTFGYDSVGRLTTITDAYANVTTIARTTAGVPTTITAPGGQVTTLTVSPAGTLTSILDPLNHGSTMTYYPGNLMATYKDALNHQNVFEYDPAGRLTKDTEPDLTFTTLALTETETSHTVVRTAPGGVVTSFVDERLPDGSQRSKEIGPTGTTTLVIPASGSSSTLTKPDGTSVTTTQVPDQRWGMQAPFTSKITTKLPSNRTMTWTSAQTVVLNNPDDPFSVDTLTITDTMDGKTKTKVYDGATRTETVTSPAGRVSSMTFDVHGRQVSQLWDTGVDPLVWTYDTKGRIKTDGTEAHATTYGYNSVNQLATRTTGGKTETYLYDLAGRVTDRTTAAGSHYQYVYDAADHRTAVIMPGGATHVLGYNVLGQKVSYTPPGNAAYASTTTPAHDIDITTLPTGAQQNRDYDPAGRLSSITYPGVVTVLTYDPASGQPDSQSRTPTAGTMQKTALAYDGPFVTSQVTTGPATGTYTYGYDAIQQIDSITLDSGTPRALTYDDDGLSTGDGPFTIGRTGPGGLTSSVSDDAMSQTLSYNTEGHPTTRSMSVGGNPVFTTTVTYDAVGLVKTKTENDGSGDTTYTYGYDDDGRLTSVDQDGTQIAAYTYDLRGNRLTSGNPASPTIATYDTQDRMATAAGVTYTFDADGYLSARGADTFTYTRRGELTSATVGGTTVSYTYDAQRRRVTNTVGGVTTQYLYGQPDQDTTVTATKVGGVTTELFYDASRHLYAMQRGANRFYVATDQLGSPRVVTDASGAVVDAIDYDAFGKIVSESDPTFKLPIGFAGGIRDSVSTLVRFGMRDYDPATGRWTARDSAFFDSGQANLYVYVGDTPTSMTDPLGLFPGISLGGSICIVFCLEAKITIGPGGIKACGGTGLGLGAGVDAGLDPDPDYKSGIYAGAHAGLGPASLDAEVFQSVCGSETTVSACVAPLCIDNDGPSLSADPRDLMTDVAELYEKPKISESVQVKATIGGCVGSG